MRLQHWRRSFPRPRLPTLRGVASHPRNPRKIFLTNFCIDRESGLHSRHAPHVLPTPKPHVALDDRRTLGLIWALPKTPALTIEYILRCVWPRCDDIVEYTCVPPWSGWRRPFMCLFAYSSDWSPLVSCSGILIEFYLKKVVPAG